MDLKEENAIGGDPSAHWYYIAKGRAIKALLGDGPVGAVLDVGAGSGVFSQMLVEEGRMDSAICVDPHYEDEFLSENQARRRTDKIGYVRSVDQVDASHVLMIDVIEHVDDDVALIGDYVRMAAPGTQFVISVPAFQFLWSSHDDFLDHRRRYTLDSLKASVEAAGLEPVEMRYFFGLLFPAAACMRLADKILRGDKAPPRSALKAAPEWLNKSLVAIHDLERAALFPFNKLAGVSAFCLAKKPTALAQKAQAA